MSKITNKEIADATQNAYSYGRYSHTAWVASIAFLRSEGLTPRQVEAFLRSKHMRWAADMAGDKNLRKAVQSYVASSWFKGDLLRTVQELVLEYAEEDFHF